MISKGKCSERLAYVAKIKAFSLLYGAATAVTFLLIERRHRASSLNA